MVVGPIDKLCLRTGPPMDGKGEGLKHALQPKNPPPAGQEEEGSLSNLCSALTLAGKVSINMMSVTLFYLFFIFVSGACNECMNSASEPTISVVVGPTA